MSRPIVVSANRSLIRSPRPRGPSSVAGYLSRVPWRCSARRRSPRQQRREPRAMPDVSIGPRKSSTQEARGHNWASHHVLPAVYGKRRSRDEAGIVGREEHHAARDLLRLAEAIARSVVFLARSEEHTSELQSLA